LYPQRQSSIQSYEGDGRVEVASNESSGIDIVVSIIQTDLTALEDYQDLAMELKVLGMWYRILSKNLASLIFQHPFAQMGQIASKFGEGIPNCYKV